MHTGSTYHALLIPYVILCTMSSPYGNPRKVRYRDTELVRFPFLEGAVMGTGEYV